MIYSDLTTTVENGQLMWKSGNGKTTPSFRAAVKYHQEHKFTQFYKHNRLGKISEKRMMEWLRTNSDSVTELLDRIKSDIL